MVSARWIGVGLGLCLVASACSKQRRDGRGAGAARDAGLAAPVVIDAAVARFTASGWEGLPWSARPDEAKVLLTARGLAFKAEEMRAYFANPGPNQPMHTNGLILKFSVGKATGYVNFESSKLENVSLQATSNLTEAEALAMQAALVHRWGAPSLRSDNTGAPVLRWYSDTTMLESRLSTGTSDTTWSHMETWLPVGSDAGIPGP